MCEIVLIFGGFFHSYFFLNFLDKFGTHRKSSSTLPKTSDEFQESTKEDSVLYEIIDMLSQIISLNIDIWTKYLSTQVPFSPFSYRESEQHTFSKLAEYNFDKLHYSYSTAIRHKASECLGLMSRIRFERISMMFSTKLTHCKSDDDYREYVSYQRAVVMGSSLGRDVIFFCRDICRLV